MEVIETKVFTRRLQALLDDGAYSLLQDKLIKNPDAGDLIQGSGGVRKIRWGVPGSGKRGGLRVVYYWAVSHDIIYMLTIYPKSEKDDLTKEEIKGMRRLVEGIPK